MQYEQACNHASLYLIVEKTPHIHLKELITLYISLHQFYTDYYSQ